MEAEWRTCVCNKVAEGGEIRIADDADFLPSATDLADFARLAEIAS